MSKEKIKKNAYSENHFHRCRDIQEYIKLSLEVLSKIQNDKRYQKFEIKYPEVGHFRTDKYPPRVITSINHDFLLKNLIIEKKEFREVLLKEIEFYDDKGEPYLDIFSEKRLYLLVKDEKSKLPLLLINYDLDNDRGCKIALESKIGDKINLSCGFYRKNKPSVPLKIEKC